MGYRNTTSWKLAGTETFRLSSAKLLGRWGGNLQNVSKDLRKIYIPDEGKVLVQVDQAGAEALIVSYLSRHGKYRDLFLNGIKPHVYIGLAFPEHWEKEHPAIHEIATLSIADIKLHPKWKALETAIKSSDSNPPSSRFYYHYKQTCHSANYGIKGGAFQLNMLQKSEGKVRLTLKQAEAYLDNYRSTFPEIVDWNKDVERQLGINRTLKNLFGFPRKFYGAWNDNILKEAYAFIPQSTVGTITNIAFTNLQTFIESENLPWDLLNNCHDSYLVQCPIGDELECAKVMKLFIEQDLVSPRGEKFKMKSEASVGYTWGDVKEVKV